VVFSGRLSSEIAQKGMHMTQFSSDEVTMGDLLQNFPPTAGELEFLSARVLT
jgi:hypothetical protein